MKYIKKPISVDAWQIDMLEIEHQGNIPDWVAQAILAMEAGDERRALRLQSE